MTRVDDGSSRKLATNAGHAAWSRDGARILFSRREAGVMVIDAGGNGERVFVRDAAQPMWSPDGSKIGFVSMESGSPQIYVAAQDGSGKRQVTTTVRIANHPDW